MTFTVAYRGADGALREERIEVANRGECFAQCRARGIAPLSVKETDSLSRRGRGSRKAEDGGRPRRDASSKSVQGDKGRQVRRRMAAYALSVACVLLAVIGGGAWWWLDRGKARPSQPEQPNKAALTKEVKPAAATGMTVTNVPSNPTVMPVQGRSGANEDVAKPPKEEIISITTNKSGYIVERVRNPDGTTSKRIWSLPPVFKHGSDQMIAMVLSTPTGQAIPPMPMNAFTDEEFLKSLEEDIVILDADSDDVKDLKAKVIVARSEIKAMMGKGYSALQVLQEHQDIFNDNAKLHTDALIEMKSILDSGDREEARKYAIAMNAAFQQMGVPELPVPSKDGADEAGSRAEAARERIKERIRDRKETTR